MSNISVIIPAAGAGRRMKSYGPKALIRLNDKTVIQKQIENIGNVLPCAEIITVLGFEADKIRRELPQNIAVVENKEYDKSNVAYSLHLGLQHAHNPNVLIVYGDLVFNQYTLAGLAYTESTAIVDRKHRLGSGEVGVTIVNDYITRFSYGLPTKWAQIVYLTGKELRIFKKIIGSHSKKNLFGFEILNSVLDLSGEIKATEPTNMAIAEIDTSKDIEDARKI